MKVEVDQTLHTVGGQGENSYATNCTLQEKAIYKAKSIVQESITKVYCSYQSGSLAIADLGCSSGPNIFIIISEILDAIHEICSQLRYQPPELMFFLNDLPGNDFNTIFKSLTSYEKKVREEKGNKHVPYYVVGAPGSFYGRLFPKESVHFMHSSSSLQWLSQVPRELEDDSGASINKGNIYIDNRSPPIVIESYQAQFRQDFTKFLKLRSEEIVSEGQMVITYLGRSNPDPLIGEMNYFFGLAAKALNSLVSEGVVEEEKMDSFDLPVYTPSMEEIKTVVLNEGSFEFCHIQTFELNWDPFDDFKDDFVADSIVSGKNAAKMARAALEPILATHFGEEIMDTFFSRYAMNVAHHLEKQKTKFVYFTIALKRRRR